MGKFYNEINKAQQEFIGKQHMFFVATAPLSTDGRINVSPKGLDSFKIISANKVAYMDLIGSGNETSAHTHENGRITFMFCAFENAPNILRLYGKAHAVLRNSDEWNEYAPLFTIYPSTRQIIVADIDLVQTSCGYGVPFYNYENERSIHFDWAETKGEEGLEKYMQEKNLQSIDGLSTDLAVHHYA